VPALIAEQLGAAKPVPPPIPVEETP
jgi:hypothetical protein